MNEDILVVWQYNNPTDLALAKAAAMARIGESKLTVLAFSADTSAISEQELADTVAAAAGDDVVINAIHCLSPTEINPWLLNAQQSNTFHMVVKTAAKESELIRDSTDWQLIRELTCPLLLSMGRQWNLQNFSVLATVDISDNNPLQQSINQSVITIAQTAETKLGASVHLTYVIAIAKALSELSIKESQDTLHHHGDENLRKLKQLANDYNLATATPHVLAGCVDEEVSSLANKLKVDLVIMGSVGRKGIKGLLLGNTAEKTIANLREDLLIIKPVN
ncbi:universal stress protein [Halioxenophilus sp. WMMB6]|uniref:universal stress protein n=1 Tax=Halioxenophilus sp. WMMB6 TaxID=3073815 RepID=UPI00295EDD63|nr:universal stress protein [Halioxenophilus sp. WMMB6]